MSSIENSTFFKQFRDNSYLINEFSTIPQIQREVGDSPWIGVLKWMECLADRTELERIS